MPAPSDVPKAYVGEHIRDELLRDPDIGELDIHVAIEGNLVVVTGHVSTDDRRRAISAALNRLMPDHEIRNETTVAVYPEAPTPSQP